MSKGESVYVPVYSSVMHGNLNDNGKPSEILLSSMLSVRNTDPKYPLILTSVQYYDTHGRVLREHLAAPKKLQPMGTMEFFVEYKEREGGSGANFVVTWKAERPINQPILETVQIYHWGTQAQSFVSRGQVIHTHEGESERKP
ncbi:MAG: DUF3124 domain-containing protein [Magnetococcales bacterium]|nr:DUF3124 domain-containing protein [Magnetococcales bacterium]